MPTITLNLVATRDLVAAPVVWRLDRLFHVVTNIRKARVSQDAAFVSLDVEGSTDEVEQARAYVQALGLTGKSGDALAPPNVAPPEDTVSRANTIVVRLDAVTPEQAASPILHRLGRDFQVVVHLERAALDDEEGWVEISISGALAELQRAIAYLHTTGLHVYPRQRSVTDYSNL